MESLAHTDPPESIIHLSLAQVLLDGVVLAIHRTHGVVALLTCDEQQPQMKAAQFFPRLKCWCSCRGMQEWETGEPMARSRSEGMEQDAVS